MDKQNQHALGRLLEVEVPNEVAEHLRVLADVRPRIRPAIGARVQPGAVQAQRNLIASICHPFYELAGLRCRDWLRLR